MKQQNVISIKEKKLKKLNFLKVIIVIHYFLMLILMRRHNMSIHLNSATHTSQQ